MIDAYFSRDEARRTLTTIVAVLAGIVLFAFFAFLVVPGLRNANRPKAAPPVTPPQGETGWLDPTEYPPAKGYVVPPVRPEELLTATPKLLERGRTLFASNCASCHGAEGRGDGPAARGLSPPPRDLTRPEGWTNGYRLGDVMTTLANGVRGTSMAPFDLLAKADRVALAHHVQALGRFPHGDDADSLAALGRELARAGEVIPPKIPVSLALARVAAEARPVAPLVPSGLDAEGAALVARAIADGERVALWLDAGAAWRESPALLAAAAVAGAPANGFRGGAALLSPADWKRLHAMLSAASARGTKREGTR